MNLKSILHFRNIPLLIMKHFHIEMITLLQKNFVSIFLRNIGLQFSFIVSVWFCYQGCSCRICFVLFQAFQYFGTCFMAHNMIHPVECSYALEKISYYAIFRYQLPQVTC